MTSAAQVVSADRGMQVMLVKRSTLHAHSCARKNYKAFLSAYGNIRSKKVACAQATKEAYIPAVTQGPETATWDPEGLLSRVPASGGHFARRERGRNQ